MTTTKKSAKIKAEILLKQFPDRDVQIIEHTNIPRGNYGCNFDFSRSNHNACNGNCSYTFLPFQWSGHQDMTVVKPFAGY